MSSSGSCCQGRFCFIPVIHPGAGFLLLHKEIWGWKCTGRMGVSAPAFFSLCPEPCSDLSAEDESDTATDAPSALFHVRVPTLSASLQPQPVSVGIAVPPLTPMAFCLQTLYFHPLGSCSVL